MLVVLGAPELLGVIEGLAPKDNEEEGVSERDELAEAVVDEVEEGVTDDVAVALAVGVFDAVLDVVTLPVAVTEGVTGGVPDGVGELLGDVPKDSVVVGVLDCDDERVEIVDKFSLIKGV